MLDNILPSSIELVNMESLHPSEFLADFPPEVLSYLFALLPLNDRKQIRLTCRSFHQSCNCPQILNNEVVKCRGNDTTIQKLKDFTRKLWNLKLEDVQFIDNCHVFSFFDLHGPNIRSLSLEFRRDSVIGSGVMEHILSRCQALCTVELYITSNYRRLDTLFDDFTALETQSVVCKDVTSFKLSAVDDKWLSNRKFLRFFTVFTSIKRLDISVESSGNQFDELSIDHSDKMSDTKFSFSSIYDRILAIGDGLEKLKLDLRYIVPPHVERTTLSTLSKLNNLKELSLEWITYSDIHRMTPDSDFNSMNLIIQCNHLTYLKCCMGFSFDHKTISCLLINNPNLSYLEICPLTVFLTFSVLRLLISSKLETLKIYTHRQFLDPECETGELLPNFRLRNLLLHSSEKITKILVITLTNHFRALQCLNLRPITPDWNLKRSLMYRTNLRSLSFNLDTQSLESDHDTTSSLLVNVRPLPFLELDQFEKLKINADTDNIHLINNQLRECSFPNLKSLSATLKNSHSRRRSLVAHRFREFLQIVHQWSQIETLTIFVMSHTSFDLWLSLCRKLQKLRDLFISGDEREQSFNDFEYRNLFHACPSLRSIKHGKTLASFDKIDCLAYYVDDKISESVQHSADTVASYGGRN